MPPSLRATIRWSLLLLAVLNAVSAIPVGFSFILVPDGSWLGTPLDMLRGTPFTDFRVPGLALTFAVGGSSVAAATLLFTRSALGPAAALLAGAVLTGWISIQVMLIGGWVFLQVLYLGVGLVLMAGGGALFAFVNAP